MRIAWWPVIFDFIQTLQMQKSRRYARISTSVRRKCPIMMCRWTQVSCSFSAHVLLQSSASLVGNLQVGNCSGCLSDNYFLLYKSLNFKKLGKWAIFNFRKNCREKEKNREDPRAQTDQQKIISTFEFYTERYRYNTTVHHSTVVVYVQHLVLYTTLVSIPTYRYNEGCIIPVARHCTTKQASKHSHSWTSKHWWTMLACCNVL